ncbi:hypothetical protein HFP15_39195 [Amycolatopsis sp. K13G38]|uniref:Serine/threonine protein kinase n=1 Tax=Amycolatopsis acididurans TaxID=2724524 RepID=A0ABX1JGG4_9PSEU|nr:hypothetical protein [Amycolatopsis acididurans]NKQ58887.1 hypothetical protein [Amycolatopsis acididurans]
MVSGTGCPPPDSEEGPFVWPVFVDRRGYRRPAMRVAAWCVALVCVGFLCAVGLLLIDRAGPDLSGHVGGSAGPAGAPTSQPVTTTPADEEP